MDDRPKALEEVNAELARELRETRLAAIFSAISLLHKLGVSGEEAENLYYSEVRHT